MHFAAPICTICTTVAPKTQALYRDARLCITPSGFSSIIRCRDLSRRLTVCDNAYNLGNCKFKSRPRTATARCTTKNDNRGKNRSVPGFCWTSIARECRFWCWKRLSVKPPNECFLKQRCVLLTINLPRKAMTRY